VKTIQGLTDGILKEISQSSIENGQLSMESSQSSGSHSPLTTHDSQLLKHAPKINTDTCRINWSQPVENIFNLVRGLSPYPAAFTIMNEKMLKIYKSKKEIVLPKLPEGEYETDGKTFLKFACTDGYLHLMEVQLEGKKKMSVEEFLRGYRF
jgi:methionyl-tRNA formyltransferase